MNANMTKHMTVPTCQGVDIQKSVHLHRKNILKRFLAKGARLVSNWEILYTLYSQKERAGITMRNVGMKCFIKMNRKTKHNINSKS